MAEYKCSEAPLSSVPRYFFPIIIAGLNRCVEGLQSGSWRMVSGSPERSRRAQGERWSARRAIDRPVCSTRDLLTRVDPRSPARPDRCFVFWLKVLARSRSAPCWDAAARESRNMLQTSDLSSIKR